MSGSVGAGRRYAFFSYSYDNLWGFRLPLMRRLVGMGASVLAVASPPPADVLPGGAVAAARRLAREGIDYAPLDLRGDAAVSAHDVVAYRRLHTIMEGYRPDVLQTFTLKANLMGARLAGGRRRLRVISTFTGLGRTYSGAGLRGRALGHGADLVTRRALRPVAAVVFQNPDDRAEFLARGLCSPQQATLIMSSGVDLGEYTRSRLDPRAQERLRGSWGIDADDVVVTMVGRLLAAKGVREFVAAARALRGRARFVLIGAAQRGRRASIPPSELEAWRDSGDVIVTGRQRDVRAWLGLTDVFVLPSSYREGVPRTILEAMAMELPIVTTDMPGCRETVVEGLNGMLVTPRRPDELVEALRRLLDDADLRRAMGSRSRLLAAQRFSVEAVVDQHLRLYRTVLARPP